MDTFRDLLFEPRHHERRVPHCGSRLESTSSPSRSFFARFSFLFVAFHRQHLCHRDGALLNLGAFIPLRNQRVLPFPLLEGRFTCDRLPPRIVASFLPFVTVPPRRQFMVLPDHFLPGCVGEMCLRHGAFFLLNGWALRPF